MIVNVKDIVSQDPAGEVWRLLRFFTHGPSVEARIREIHKLGSAEHKANVAKQATQIGYCIRQAEQYFTASNGIGPATRPLLLYYGVVSLSQAVVLLRKDGNLSHDKRREGENHKHHGLELRGLPTSKCDTPTEFLGSTKARCYTKDKERKSGWGQFYLFYESLEQPAFSYVAELRNRSIQSVIVNQPVAQMCADPIPAESLLLREFNVLELLKNLPDLFHLLGELGIPTKLVRGSFREVSEIFQKEAREKVLASSAKSKGKVAPLVLMENRTRDFFIDGLNENGKRVFIDLYSNRTPALILQNDLGSSMHFHSKFEREVGAELTPSYFPDIVDNIGGAVFYIAEPNNFIPEPASFFIVLYCLGMLSRYYPDVWMGALERDIQTVELTNAFLNVTSRKMPNLILDQLTGIKHSVHQ